VRQCGIPAGALVASALLPWLAHLWSWRWALAVAGAITIATVLPLTLAPIERSFEMEAAVAEGSTVSPARDRNIRLLTLWGCMVVTGQYVILAFFALDLHQNAGLSLVSASLLVAAANAAGIVGRLAWGGISDRVLSRGRKPLLLVLNSAGLVAAIAMFATPRSAPLGVFVVLAAILGFALIGYQGLFITVLAEMAGPRRVGAATGFALSFTQTAISLTPPAYGLVADIFGTYRATWGALVCVLAVALIPASLIRERRDQPV
jgi:predicted MFS family arabinose efflux permease